MTGDEHDCLSRLLGDDAWAAAQTAEDQLAADWATHSALLRHRDRSPVRPQRRAASA